MNRPSRDLSTLPVALRGALLSLLGAGVGAVELVERSWRVRWHPRMCATTRRNRIYLRGSVEDFASDPALVLHEYYHVIEQWNRGQLTRSRYLWELLRRGYRANRFEVETREFVARNLGRFQRLIEGRVERGGGRASRAADGR
jgi:hypothetical protein